MADAGVLQRVDSAEMLDLFSQAMLLDEGDDFLSPTKQNLTHDDVRHLRLDPKEESRGFLAPVRTGSDARSELNLRATGKEDAWLVLSPSQVSVSTADSIDDYLKLKDATRASFARRNSCASSEGERRQKGSVKAFAKQAGCKAPARETSLRRKPSIDRGSSLERRASLGGCSDKSGSTAYGCAGGRRKQTPSPAPTTRSSRSSLEGKDPLQSYSSSSCATPTPAPDPPNSPCSSTRSSRLPTPKGGRSRLPSPTLSDCRSNISSPAPSDPYSRFSSPTPSERSVRREGQKSWPAGPGSDCDPFSPKSSVGEYGHVSLESPFADENMGGQAPKQKLLSGGLTKLQKQMKAAQEAAKKGTKLKAKQEGGRWRGA
ncbi:unnamed protein product [Ostreobium quekettii]|uniref:Uncharacterized protein n=1 Tax=Ostreobium quekettii TaxID=121088 RepID=A0A8S1JAN7_9CHLO|nr:unnamed protein product [Ostreobium quekettii]|eukprot:evm.model.scf_1433.1 EVM.evm.TU.scf_1433.1   scf_1433:9775-13281(-)